MFKFVPLTFLALAWRAVAQSSSHAKARCLTINSDSPSGGTPTSTVYFAPVTITNPASCTKTSFAYIAMESLTDHVDIAATMSPWTTTSFMTTSTDVSDPTPFLQVDVFLDEQPFPINPNGEELAWQKVCYDPRDTPCPSSVPISGPSHLTCMSAFPGATITSAPPPVISTGAAAGSVQPSSRTVTLFGALAAGSLTFLLGL